MDPDPPLPPSRKVKFPPKKLPRRPRRLTTTEIEEDVNDDNQESQQFLAGRVSEHLAMQGGKLQKKLAPVQVAFSHGGASTSIRSFGRQRERTHDGSRRTNGGSIAAYSEAAATGEMENLFTSISAAERHGLADNTVDLTDAAKPAIAKEKKEYREPWDYEHTYYPTTLPLRKPYSGNPEVLDKAEFEGAPEYDENSLSSASHLGLQADNDTTPRMLVFMFPSDLPLGRPTDANKRKADDNLKAVEKSMISEKGKEKSMVGSVAKSLGISNGKNGKEIAGRSMDLTRGHPLKNDSRFEELHEGYMGKMLVYKSGAVKLTLGEIAYDVYPRCDPSCPQKVMAINTTKKQCCELGDGDKWAVVTPDIDSLLNSDMASN